LIVWKFNPNKAKLLAKTATKFVLPLNLKEKAKVEEEGSLPIL
jgi:hypothetical protein